VSVELDQVNIAVAVSIGGRQALGLGGNAIDNDWQDN
jgi:hypothetical protein